MKTVVVSRHATERYLTRIEGLTPEAVDDWKISHARIAIQGAVQAGRLLHERTLHGDRYVLCPDIGAAFVVKDSGSAGRKTAWKWLVITTLDLAELRRERDEWTARVDSAIERISNEEELPASVQEAIKTLQVRLGRCREDNRVLRIEVEGLRDAVVRLTRDRGARDEAKQLREAWADNLNLSQEEGQ